MKNKLVTIGIPVHKRLDYLPNSLEAVRQQDYDNIELIVSDNGQNGSAVRELACRHFGHEFEFRQNPATVDVATHLNQLVQVASGEYFVLLCDDDDISPNYVSQLVGSLENNPGASLAFSRMNAMDQHGTTTRGYDGALPPVLSGNDFVRAWCRREKWLDGPLATNLARTMDIRTAGAHPVWPRALNTDFALAIKLCLGSHVVFNPQCMFRHRRYEADNASNVTSASPQEVVEATRLFLTFVDNDPEIRRFAERNPTQWEELRKLLTARVCGDYLHQWFYSYRRRFGRLRWLRAGFRMPLIPVYYASMLALLFPRLYRFYRGFRTTFDIRL